MNKYNQIKVGDLNLIADANLMDGEYVFAYPSDPDLPALEAPVGPASVSEVAHGMLVTQAASGIKYDDSKPALQYVPKAAMFAMGEAFAHGAKKYGAFNYRGGLATTRTLAAAVRHIYQFLDGENLDSESGKSHLGHAMASIAMTLDTLEKRPDLDDRPGAKCKP